MAQEDESDFNIDITTIPLAEIDNYIFIDVREQVEIMINPVKNIESVHLPFSKFGHWDYNFAKNKEYLVFCAHGMRSLSCVERLQEEGVTNIWSVANGAEALQKYFVAKPKVKK